MNAVVGVLLRLFPRDFRNQFGEDIAEQVRIDHARARARGAVPATAFTIATGLDLLRSALAERRRPTWTTGPPTSPEKPDMTSTFGKWLHDFRQATRILRRAPGFVALTVGTLGLAIGANVGIFSIVDAVLLNPLPYADADRLVHIAASAPGSDFPDEFGVSAEFYVQYGELSSMLEDLSTYNSGTSTLRVGDRAERVRMSWPTNSLFSTLQAVPLLGRLPREEDGNEAAVLSHTLWTTWFSADPGVIGETIFAAGRDRTVIGVMGLDFWFPRKDVLLWMSSEIRADDLTPGRFTDSLVARVAPGTDLDALRGELTDLARRLPERFGGSVNYARLIEQHRAVVRPVEEQLLGPVTRPLWVLLGAVALVLVIACANVANLFLVRAERRQRDLALQRALGAGRGELVRAQMAETLIIAGLAAVVAVVLAWLGVPLFLTAAPAETPRIDEVGMNATSILYAFGVALLSALACGLIPAIRASAPRLTRLREAGRGATRGRHWVRDGLVVGQTALALVLLIGSGLLLRSFQELRQVDPGYDTDDLFTFQIAPEGAHLNDGPTFARFHMDFMDRIRALPGVESVGIVENVPLNEGLTSASFVTEDNQAEEDGGSQISYTWAGGDYFSTMGIAVLEGRPFRDADHTPGPGNVVVSEAMATLLWPGESAVGKRLRTFEGDDWYTVVGVVEDILQYGFRDAPQPMAYFPLVGPTPESWSLGSPGYVVKTTRTDEIGPEIRALVREVAPGAPMYRVFTMAGLAADSMVQLSFTMVTLGLASTLALMLGAIGLFGILSYVVAERTREIGVRMALGAEAARVRRMVVAQGARLVGLGVFLGVAVALASTRALGTLLFGVQAVDVPTFVAMSLMLVAVGLLAAYMPARRASNVDPIESLRE